MRLRAFHKDTKELCNVFQILQPDSGEPMIIGWNGQSMRMDWGNWIILRPSMIGDAGGRMIYEYDSMTWKEGNNALFGIVKWMDSECAFFVEVAGELRRLNEAFVRNHAPRVVGCSLVPQKKEPAKVEQPVEAPKEEPKEPKVEPPKTPKKKPSKSSPKKK